MKTIFALLLVMSLADVAFAGRLHSRKNLESATVNAEQAVDVQAVVIRPLPVIKPPVFADEVSCISHVFYEHAYELGEQKVTRSTSGNGFSVVEAIVDSRLNPMVKLECKKVFKMLGIVSKATVKVTCTSTSNSNIDPVDIGETKVIFKDTSVIDCLYQLDGDLSDK